MKKHTLLAAATLAFLAALAALATLNTTQAHAYPIGNLMDYESTTVSSGGTTAQGTGYAVFDSSGLLTLESIHENILPSLGWLWTTIRTTLFDGTISGTTWTSTGSGTATTQSCVGPPCGRPSSYPVTVSIIPQLSSLDIYSGGAWSHTSGSQATTSHTLTPSAVPAPPTAWLFGLAMLGLTALGWKHSAI